MIGVRAVTGNPVKPVLFHQGTYGKFPNVTFGASESKKTDPKPGFGFQNLKYALVMAASLAGFQYTGPAVNNFHRWSHQRQQLPVASATVTDQMLDSIAALDKKLSKNSSVVMAENIYLFLIQWQMLMLAFIAGTGTLKKTIRPDQLANELHHRGITGKGLKVAVIDSGYMPSGPLKHKPPEFLAIGDEKSQGELRHFDDVGHGSAVTNIIAQACPESEFVVMPSETDKERRKLIAQISRKRMAYLKKCLNNPEELTLKGVRESMMPMVEHVAKGVRKAVDEGAHVVNISLSPVQAIEQQLSATEKVGSLLRRYHEFLSYFQSDTARQKKMLDKAEKLQLLAEKANQLMTQYQQSGALDADVRAVFKPWIDVLDYAHRKGVAVVVAAGNDGGHKADQDDYLGNINLFGGIEHPALIVVGSTDEKGKISKFTTEYNNEVRPLVAANGSGELSTASRTTLPSLSLFSLPFLPLVPMSRINKQVQYMNPKGTSFAAPDTAATYILMKSAAPSLTLEEARQLMQENAGPAYFSRFQNRRIRTEVIYRLLNRDKTYQAMSAWNQFQLRTATILKDMLGFQTTIPPEAIQREMQAEIARRVGSGTLAGNRLKVVEAAEQLEKRKKSLH